MRIAVFGGTGATGRLLIDQALDRGLSVTAYARHPEKLGIEDDRLTVVAGELSDSAAIDRAVKGSDAVISLLGQGRPVKGTPVALGTRTILAAMDTFGVRRIVAVATASAADPRDKPGLRTGFADAVCLWGPSRSLWPQRRAGALRTCPLRRGCCESRERPACPSPVGPVRAG